MRSSQLQSSYNEQTQFVSIKAPFQNHEYNFFPCISSLHHYTAKNSIDFLKMKQKWWFIRVLSELSEDIFYQLDSYQFMIIYEVSASRLAELGAVSGVSQWVSQLPVSAPSYCVTLPHLTAIPILHNFLYHHRMFNVPPLILTNFEQGVNMGDRVLAKIMTRHSR